MARQTKYIKGEGISDFDALLHEIHAGRWVYLGDRPKHPLWLHCMSVQVIEGALRSGRLHCAIERQKAVICDHAAGCDLGFCIHHQPHERMSDADGCGAGSFCRYRRENVGCIAWEEPCSLPH